MGRNSVPRSNSSVVLIPNIVHGTSAANKLSVVPESKVVVPQSKDSLIVNTTAASKKLIASIEGMTVSEERRFLNIVRRFPGAIKSDTKLGDAPLGTAGEYALKYLIGQSVKRRRKTMMRRGMSPTDVDFAVQELVDKSATEDIPALDISTKAEQRKKVRKAGGRPADATAAPTPAPAGATSVASRKRKQRVDAATDATPGTAVTHRKRVKPATTATAATAVPAAATASVPVAPVAVAN